MISRSNTDAVIRRCPLCQTETACDSSGLTDATACRSCGVGLVRSSKLLARLQALARKHPELELEEITAQSSWPLGGDSLTAVEVMVELERELEVSISAADVERIMTVGDAIRYFDKRTRET